MKQQITLTGIVLSSTLIGDYDKRVVILTKEKGKITAFARGVRRPGNVLMAICQPLNFGKFNLYEGFDAYKLVSGDINNYFMELKSDLEAVCYARYFCELAEALTLEGSSDKSLLNLLYLSFKALTRENMPNILVRRIFEIKILALEGTAIYAFGCVKCGKKEHTEYFDAGSGGFLCESCAKNISSAISISESTVYTIQYILSSSLEKIFAFNVSGEVQAELNMICERFMYKEVNRKFKSIEIIDSLT